VEPVVSALHAETMRSPSTMRARRRLEGIRQLTTRPDGHRGRCGRTWFLQWAARGVEQQSPGVEG
jgi:hypothetical protein